MKKESTNCYSYMQRFTISTNGDIASDGSATRRALLGLAALVAVLAVVAGLLRVACYRYMCAAYPLEYRVYVEKYAQEYGFESSFLFALIQTESGFDPEAISPAKAMGLMQITEDTFLWAQDRSHVEEIIPTDRLFDPETNIRFGTLVLSLLREEFSDTRTLLAAYNAGMGNARKWLKDTDYSDDGVTLKDIPFAETRNYVDRIPAAQAMYKKLYKL